MATPLHDLEKHRSVYSLMENLNLKFLASFKDECRSLHATVKKMLQVFKNSFYENKLDAEKFQLRKINNELIKALSQKKSQ